MIAWKDFEYGLSQLKDRGLVCQEGKFKRRWKRTLEWGKNEGNARLFTMVACNTVKYTVLFLFTWWKKGALGKIYNVTKYAIKE